MKKFTVEAIRTDSWLGIEAGERYATTVYEISSGKRTMVHTNGYTVFFNEKDFKIISSEGGNNQ